MKKLIEYWDMYLNNQYNMPFPYKIYCDMDGVLVDLVGGVLKEANLSVEDEQLRGGVTHILKTGWSWLEPHPDPKIQKGLEYINDLISNNLNFWKDLPPTIDKGVLWDYISQFDPNVLTHPWDDASADGKSIWLKNNLNPAPNMAFYSGEKYKWATTKDGKPNLLIDDFEKYTIPWEKAGGIAILHRSAADTIKQLELIRNETS